MATLEVLNIHTHATLQMAAPTSGDRHFVQVVLDEIESAGAHFPILFCKNAETGDFYAGAMLGLKPGENLVRDEPDGEQASRLHDVVREGFYIAEDAIAIDPQHPRFGVGDGLAVFEADGDATLLSPNSSAEFMGRKMNISGGRVVDEIVFSLVARIPR
ncbi:MAG: hypothetical protein EOO77_42180 [Oxalobacteraceae bacterium]|nr:MAG: hypothetical protein EOO77_42180 [Oxalobacteraceae bacterium]